MCKWESCWRGERKEAEAREKTIDRRIIGTWRRSWRLNNTMDITGFVLTHRAEALSMGDYNKYRAMLTRRLHTLNKRLGRTTPKNKKFSSKAAITSSDIAKDQGYVFVQLIVLLLVLMMAVDMFGYYFSRLSEHGQKPCTCDPFTLRTRQRKGWLGQQGDI